MAKQLSKCSDWLKARAKSIAQIEKILDSLLSDSKVFYKVRMTRGFTKGTKKYKIVSYRPVERDDDTIPAFEISFEGGTAAGKGFIQTMSFEYSEWSPSKTSDSLIHKSGTKEITR